MIWVVTDDHAAGDALVKLIGGKGYNVDRIDCSAEVPKRIRFQTPAMAIIDCGMADSFELVAAIRAHPKARSVPVVMFSKGDHDLRDEALLRGADAFVTKSALDWADLLREIRRFAGDAGDANLA